MNKHTPGPWIIETRNVPLADTGDFDGVVAVVGPMNTTVVEFWNGNEVDDENAKLIAAAPELLAIAKEHAASCPSCNGTGQRMHSYDRNMVDCQKCRDTRAAIAKATGEA